LGIASKPNLTQSATPTPWRKEPWRTTRRTERKSRRAGGRTHRAQAEATRPATPPERAASGKFRERGAGRRGDAYFRPSPPPPDPGLRSPLTKSLYGASTIFGQHAGMPPDEHMLALRQVDQLRTDMANLEVGQEFLMQQINRLPTARDLWRAVNSRHLYTVLIPNSP